MPQSFDIISSRTRIATLVLIGAVLSACTGRDSNVSENEGQWSSATILIGVDGLRWDFPERFDLDTILDVAEAGVRAGSLAPAFPTKTFPNFYTLATGLFPNHTGILDNTIYDPDLDATFRMSDASAVRDGRWWGGEPVWVTAERQNKRAAVFFWPGSEAEISGHRPTFWKAYDGSIPNEERVKQALAWLNMSPSERPSLILLYFAIVDEVGHRHGPDADETAAAAMQVDGLIRQLRSGLAASGLQAKVNIVIVSDHGLASRSGDRVVYLDDYLDLESAGVLSLGQHVTIWPKPEAIDAVYFALANAHPELKVYKSDDLPSRYHLAGHRRTPPIVAVPSTGWTVSTRRRAGRRPGQFSGGAHGYDNSDPDMHGVFVAAGPSFRSGVRIDSVRAVDVYNLVVHSIDLEPALNDGDASIIPHLMTRH